MWGVARPQPGKPCPFKCLGRREGSSVVPKKVLLLLGTGGFFTYLQPALQSWWVHGVWGALWCRLKATAQAFIFILFMVGWWCPESFVELPVDQIGNILVALPKACLWSLPTGKSICKYSSILISIGIYIFLVNWGWAAGHFYNWFCSSHHYSISGVCGRRSGVADLPPMWLWLLCCKISSRTQKWL